MSVPHFLGKPYGCTWSTKQFEASQQAVTIKLKIESHLVGSSIIRPPNASFKKELTTGKQ